MSTNLPIGFEPRGQDVTLWVTLDGKPRSATYTSVTYNPGLEVGTTSPVGRSLPTVHGVQNNPTLTVEFTANDPFFEDLVAAQAKANEPNETRSKLDIVAHLRTHYGPGGVRTTKLAGGVFHGAQQSVTAPADKARFTGVFTFNKRPAKV